MTTQPLAVQSLYRACDQSSLGFETTATLEPLTERLGQARAVEAIDFAIAIPHDGYNLFAMGPPEAGKETTVRHAIEPRAAKGVVPEDVAYVADFETKNRPRALRLPAGRAKQLAKDVDQLIDELRQAVPAALEGEELSARKHALEEELKSKQEAAFGDLQKRAADKHIALIHTPMGFALAPVKDDEIVPPSEFAKLPEEERNRLEKDIEELGQELQARLSEVPRWAQDARRKVKALIRETLSQAVSHLIDDIKQKYEPFPAVADHLTALGLDVLDNVGAFIGKSEREGREGREGRDGPNADPSELSDSTFRRYRVNVIVDHSETKGAPVVFEEHPTYDNLFGRIEHLSHLGALVTDFNMIRAGALHRANGGYLLLDARNLLIQPLAYESLKRALDSKQVKIDGLGRALGIISTVSLEPEPIPLDVKVVLLGDRRLHYLLEAYDPEYHAIFKVAADFEDTIPRSRENDLRYARLLAGLIKDRDLLALDRRGVARLIERSARIAEDAERLTTHVGTLRDLVCEADHFARRRGATMITAEDVDEAVAAGDRRDGRIRERVLEEIERGTIMIDTAGAKVAQLNGLSVLMIGRASFGRPSRITARVRLGKGEVVNIEREVELSGPLHSKGVLILSGFLAGRYALDHPLSLSATLTFEQSYGMIDGDSASSAELYVLLSALAEIPLAQGIAVTGSVNQLGEVQAIGGVNEKIEGFFDVCLARGLTGDQGVLIPASNVKHLMLKRVVREAVEAGKFRVWAVSSIDEGIEILTGEPREAVHQKVEEKLVALAKRRVALAESDKKEGSK